MKFLSKLGKILLQATQIITGLGPMLPAQGQVIGKVIDTLEKLTDVIIGVETFGQVLDIPGPDKLRAAVPLAAQVLLKSDLLIGKKIDNHPLFMQGVTKMTDGLADVLNSLKDDIDAENVT